MKNWRCFPRYHLPRCEGLGYHENMSNMIRSTTILCVRRGEGVAIGGDGQVTMNDTIAKADAVKIRRLTSPDGKTVLTGFAGSAADAFALLERFEGKLKDSPGNIKKAAIELAKLWRTDRLLRRLEAMLIITDERYSLLVSGQGDVIEPDEGVIGIGSGGNYAVAAARALIKHTDMPADQIAREALNIAAQTCVYTNTNITVETI